MRLERTTASSKSRRQRSNRRGERAEWLAAIALMVRGYRVLERRYRVSGGEIDLIVRRGSTVAFVEVKIRSSLDEALLAVTSTKSRRITRAASVWLSRNPWALGYSLRGDAVIAAPRRWPRHIEAAFPVALG